MFFSKRKQRKKETAAIPASDDRTCLIADSGEDEKTVFWSGRDEDVPTQEAEFTIKLTDLKNQNRTWTLTVAGELLVGRAEHCTVQFYDQSVSREQFKIVVQGEKLYLVQIGATNQTKQNGAAIDKCAVLCSGDILKFGRESLRVDYIETRHPAPDLEPSGEYVPGTAFRENEDDTMSFF